MTLLRRFLVVQAFAVWQGGFVFYSAVVVPVGTGVLGSAAIQGEITRSVTDWLNLLGGGWGLVFLWELLAQPDPDRSRRRRRWLVWATSVGLLIVLVWLHLKMDNLFDDDGHHIDRLAFRRWHIVYLWVSTIHWMLGLVLVWLTVRVWSVSVTGEIPPNLPVHPSSRGPEDQLASIDRCPPPGM